MKGNGSRILLAILLTDFVSLTAYAVYQYGVVAFYELLTANAIGMTVGADLLIALGMVVTWMARDARERGINIYPYVLLTAAFGSVGPLAYLLRRPRTVAA